MLWIVPKDTVEPVNRNQTNQTHAARTWCLLQLNVIVQTLLSALGTPNQCWAPNTGRLYQKMITPPNLVITSLSILCWNLASHLVLIADLHSYKLPCNTPQSFFTEQHEIFAHPTELELASDSQCSSMNNYFINLLAILNQINQCHLSCTTRKKFSYIFQFKKNDKKSRAT